MVGKFEDFTDGACKSPLGRNVNSVERSSRGNFENSDTVTEREQTPT